MGNKLIALFGLLFLIIGYSIVSSSDTSPFEDKSDDRIISYSFPRAQSPASTTEPLFLIVQDDKYGFIDSNRQIVIEPQYKEAREFKEELAMVWLETSDCTYGCGFINKDGLWVIQPVYKLAHDFSEGLALVLKNDKWHYIDMTGSVVISPDFEAEFGDFSEGLALFTQRKYDGTGWYGYSEERGYLGLDGNITILPEFEYAGDFSEGLAYACEDSRYGFIDKEGNWVIEPIYWEALWFSEGLAGVQVSDPSITRLWGYIDHQGNMVIPPSFDPCGVFKNGYATVWLDGKCGVIDKTGTLVANSTYYYFGEFSDGLFAVQCAEVFGSCGSWGFMDENGTMVLPCVYNKVRNFQDGLAIVSMDNGYAYIDTTGNIVWGPVDESINLLGCGL